MDWLPLLQSGDDEGCCVARALCSHHGTMQPDRNSLDTTQALWVEVGGQGGRGTGL